MLVPGVPSNVSMTASSTEMTVTWNSPHEPNGKIVKYGYKFFETDAVSFFNTTMKGLNPSSELSEMSKTFKDLKVYTRYSFSIRAATKKGYGEWSPVITKFTDPKGNLLVLYPSFHSFQILMGKCNIVYDTD